MYLRVWHVLFPVVRWTSMGLWALAVAAGLVMIEISRLLATLAVADRPSYPAEALSGWPGFNPFDDDQRFNAVAVWAGAAGKLKVVDGSGLVLNWIRTYLSLDLFVFTPAYVIAIYLLLRKIWDVLGEDPPFPKSWIKWFVLSVLLCDSCETVLTWFLVGDLEPSHAFEDAVAFFSFLKWATLTVTVLFGLLGFARTLPITLAPWLNRWKRGALSTRRVWTRHRNQLGVLLVLALLVVMPGEGPLEQLPDIARTWAGNDFKETVGDALGPLVALFGLCLALWVAGRWALLDGAPKERQREWTRTLPLLLGLGGILLVAALVLHSSDYATLGALAIPTIVLVVGGWSLLLPRSWRDPATEETRFPTNTTRERTRNMGRVLAVVPLIIAGLGLTRAYARPYLLGPEIAASAHRLDVYTPVVVWFWIGVGAVVLVGPVVNDLVRRAEDRWLDRPEVPDPKLRGTWRDRRRWVPTLLGGVLLLAATCLGVLLALEPIEWGARLRSLGVLVLLLTTVTLVAGGLARHAEYHLPLPLLRYLHFRLTPIWLLVVAALVLEAQLDTTGGYHEVRLKRRPPSDSASAQPLDSEKYFKAWLASAQRCMNGDKNLRRATAVPMVFVAAPGGGIRAAYWTGSAMDELTKSPCARDMIFATSGVSGGSLGLVGHALGPKPGKSTAHAGRDFARRLAGEDTLAANMAAMFYRDLPRALHGINKLGRWRPGDRATVFERSWEQLDDRLTGEFFPVAHQPVESSPWRPLPLLNGTDVSSGCRVVVSSVWGTGGPTNGAAPTLSCQDAEVAARTEAGQKAVDPAGFAAAAIDAAAYTDRYDCAESGRSQGLRLSTAVHLSARFPYISPSGRMHRCDTSTEPQTLADLDGGLLESSGLAILLELWEELEPQVAEHNRAVTKGGEGPFVLPLIAVLDNHYQSLGSAPRAKRPMEVLAPLVASGAPKAALSATTLEQVALYRFSGALPGTTAPPTIGVGDNDCSPVRSFFAAPSNRPGIAAPLGWVLSGMSRNDLDAQLEELVQPEHNQCQTSHSAAPDTRGQTPGTLRTLLNLLKGPVTVNVKAR